MRKNRGLWIVVMLAVIGWNLYSILGPHDEAPSQTLVILQWILVLCGVAGLIGVLMQPAQQKSGDG